MSRHHFDLKLLGKLSQCCASKSLKKYLKLVLGKKIGIPGGGAIQTFGDYARWHSHLHALVADGLFLQSGYFFVMPKVDIRPLSEIFRAYVLKMPKKEGFLSTSI